VENLIPRGAPHKGDALLHLLDFSGCGRALFAGDDETDEDVFRLDDPRIFRSAWDWTAPQPPDTLWKASRRWLCFCANW